jgi:RNA polymerase sigma-70 factor (ECF subfamily)
MASEKIQVEALLAESVWLTELARRLVHDPHFAEDLAQETMVKALGQEQPRGSLRRWLEVVIRNLAAQFYRSESRRRRNEQAATLADSPPSTLQVVNRLALHRALVEAISGLAEPYRTTVLLRYIEGKMPREIAALQKVPVKTVKTRLNRALTLLRERLDQQFHGRRNWAMALCLPSSAATSVASGNPARLKTQRHRRRPSVRAALVAVGASVLFVVFAVLHYDRGPERQDTASPPAVGRSVGGSAAAPLSAAVTRRSDLGGALETAAPGRQSLQHAMLRGRVLDVRSRPVPGVQIFHELGGGKLQSIGGEAAVIADAEGRFVCAAREVLQTLVAKGEGWVTVMSALHEADATQEAMIIVASARPLTVQVVDEFDRPVPETALFLRMPDSFETWFGSDLARSQRRPFLTRTGLDGTYHWPAAPSVEGAMLSVFAEGFGTRQLRIPAAPQDWLEVQVEGGERSVAGRVFDATGRPVANALVAVGRSMTRSDLEGRYGVVAKLTEGAEQVVAVHPSLGSASTRWPQSAPAHVDLQLQPARNLRGTVLDSHGDPVDGARVWIADPTPFGELGARPAFVEHLLAGAYSPFSDQVDHLRQVVCTGPSFRGPMKGSCATWNWVGADELGKFSIPVLSGREYELVAQDPVSLATSRFSSTDGPVVVPMPGTEVTLSGRILDRERRPLTGVKVQIVSSPYRAKAASADHGDVPGFSEGGAAITGFDGSFRFPRVARSGIGLKCSGPGILPATRWLTAEQTRAAIELTVSRRCFVEVVLTQSDQADSLHFTDANGERCPVYFLRADRTLVHSSQEIVNGRSGLVAVGEEARHLVLTREGEEVERLAVVLRPGDVLSIRR